VPIQYVIDPNERTIRTKCVGQLSLSDVIGHFQTLAADPQFAGHLNVFLDLSEVSSLPDGREILAVVTELKRIRSKARFGACAILATGDALFGMMRVFEAHAEEFFRVTHTFRSATEAETWFALQKLSQDKPAAGGENKGQA
jgi:hypothetical protein